ncbi:MAG: RNA polymerase sigma factor [Planctomycetes bacterium]|nr:RNA polymerase sigma factor [Planctomycetota bacterium]
MGQNSDDNRSGRSDWELFASLRPDDHSAFSELVGRHYRASVAFCAQVLGDRDEAEDIVQRGFVKLFQARDRYEERAQFRTLLFRVLLNLCLNELSKHSPITAQTGSTDDDVLDLTARLEDRQAVEPSQRLEDRELGAMIRQAVLALKPKHRAALYLREYGQLSYTEIAQSLDASLSEVKIWIHRARLSVQESLKPYLDRGEALR